MVTVAVCTRDRPDELERCLDALSGSARPATARDRRRRQRAAERRDAASSSRGSPQCRYVVEEAGGLGLRAQLRASRGARRDARVRRRRRAAGRGLAALGRDRVRAGPDGRRLRRPDGASRARDEGAGAVRAARRLPAELRAARPRAGGARGLAVTALADAGRLALLAGARFASSRFASSAASTTRLGPGNADDGRRRPRHRLSAARRRPPARRSSRPRSCGTATGPTWPRCRRSCAAGGAARWPS